MEHHYYKLYQSEGAAQLLITPDFIGRIDGVANVDDVSEDNEADVDNEDDEMPYLEDDKMPDLEEADSSSETDSDHLGEEEEELLDVGGDPHGDGAANSDHIHCHNSPLRLPS